MAASGKEIIDTLQALRGKRSPHEQDWRDCFDLTFPVRGNGFAGQVIDSANARGKIAARLDSTGTDSARTLASALKDGTTSANSLWFGIDVGDESPEEREWLDEAARIIWENVHASNFDAVGFEAMLDMVPAGWFVLFTDLDREKGGGYAFDLWPISQCYVASTRADGVVDTIYREYTLSAAQAVNYFDGKRGASVSDKLRRKAADKPMEAVQLVRVIRPRKGYVPGGKLVRSLPFESCDVEVDGQHVACEEGFHEFPCAVPRWTLIPGTVYAVGPAFDALPDMLELNDLVRMEKAAADLAISGMWIAEDDGVLNPRTVKVGPRKVIVANSVDSMKPLKPGADFNVSFTIKAQLQAQIRKTLLADQLQPQDGPQMTATEVHVRVGLIRQLLGPIYGRMQSEYLQPLIERCFGLAVRAGALGPPPETLANRPYHVRYLSTLARAQKLEDVVAMDRFETGLLAQREMAPDITDMYDFEAANRQRAQYLGVPGKLLRSDDTLKQMRQARQEANEQAAQREQMAAQAEALSKNPQQAQVMGALMEA